jgi:hypothetical protein
MTKLFFLTALFLVHGSYAISQETTNKKDTLFNSKDYLVIGPLNGNIKVLVKGSENKHPSFQIISKHQNDLILSDNLTFDQVDIYRKYKPLAAFDDYLIPVFNGKLTAPNFESNLASKNFITRIKAACEGGINFAGHYTLVEWGCGTACQTGVLVDRKTGEIHDRPTSSLGTDFKSNSTLFIENIGAVDKKLT